MCTPEEQARQIIDDRLTKAGWIIQDRADFDRTAAVGVAVREFMMKDGTEADYLLFVNGKAAGVIEAKKSGVSLSGVENQSAAYAAALPDYVKKAADFLPFVYEATDTETWFTDYRDHTPRARRVFSFHRPETLATELAQETTLRNRLQTMPPLNKIGLRQCQIEAITGLENSLAKGQPRSLIQMATGAGKTFTACNFVYRLIKHAKAKRVLFLVDRNNLGAQTKKEFSNFYLNDENRPFTDAYIVQHMQHNTVDKDAKVVITTIQRLYSMLRGEADYDSANEDVSAYELGALGNPATVEYNRDLPPEFFDFIVTDECHRSIYGDWRQVLEYFDAFTVGLTATPSKMTLGYFNQNIVAEYPYERSVIDGVNVDYEVLRIRTKITEQGGIITHDFPVLQRDKKTRRETYGQIDDDIAYTPNQLDRSIRAPNQIRTIIQCYKDTLWTELFPNRDPTWVPKTLIFAKDDDHAEEIVRITREVFGKDNAFCKKITYNVTGEKPSDLINEFRTSPTLRVAVTVDMIATGTDIKPLEVLIFMRDVHSELYYEQMKGRGVRSVSDTDLQSVTPNARAKTHFFLIDAVGVTESNKSASQPLERKRAVPLKKLAEQLAQGKDDDDTLDSVAVRLVKIQSRLERADVERVKAAANGKDLVQIAREMTAAADADFQAGKTDAEIEAAKQEAVKPFNSPAFRQTLLDLASKSVLYIDFAPDEVLTAPVVGTQRAQDTVKNFRDFIESNKDEITALQIIFNHPRAQQTLTFEAIKDLSDKMAAARPPLDLAGVWNAYADIERDKVKRVTNPARLLTNLVQLVRFAIGADETLTEFDAAAEQRFNLWLGRQKKRGVEFTAEQTQWLQMIKTQIIENAAISTADVQEIFADRGGLFKARQVFGNQLNDILTDLSATLMG